MKILILTKIYPADDLSKAETPVVHYFAKEWVKKGYEVKVIVNYPVFPNVFYIVINKCEKLLTSMFGALIPKRCTSRCYRMDDVNIYRLSMQKKIPHAPFTRKAIWKQADLIKGILDKDRFVPDIIVGHWWNPQLQLISILKKKYICKTALVLHSHMDIICVSKFKNLLADIDSWGFRSVSLKSDFEGYVGNTYKTFLCYSGIPANLLSTDIPSKVFSSRLSSFLFVGQLITRKYPIKLLLGVKRVYKSFDSFTVTFVGDGNEEKAIRKLSRKLAFEDHVLFTGRIPRDKVKEYMDKNECFIMISKNEAFGLVYLEAMSAGCIVIASKGEGFDGIIKDGVNGFLCKAGDDVELSNIIKKINLLSISEKEKISRKAIQTAYLYTDEKVADMYLKGIMM